MASVRYWAAARDFAGTAEEIVASGPLPAVLDQVRTSHGPRMARLIDTALLLLDGEPVVCDASIVVADDSVLEILPPFAGG